MTAQSGAATNGVAPRTYAIDLVLQCCRGIAALWVFMFHISDMIAPVSATWLQIATYGHYGVPLFFAISGYCMYASAASTVARGGTPWGFLQRRLVRVMPPFWLSILAVMAVPFVIALISLAKSGRYDWPQTSWMALTALDWLQVASLTRGLFHPELPGQAAYTAINAVYWTLAIELQFYLVMAAALAFKTQWKRIVLVVVAVSLVSIMASLASPALFLEYWPAFALGMLLRVAHVKGWTPARCFGRRELGLSLFAALSMVAALIACMLQPQPILPANGSALAAWVFSYAALLSVLLLWLLGGIEHGAGRLHQRPGAWRLAWFALLPLTWVGQCSYSLYLLHGRLFQLPAMFVRQLVPNHSWLAPTLTIGATAVLCYGFYLLAEWPFQHGGRWHFGRSKAKLAGAAA